MTWSRLVKISPKILILYQSILSCLALLLLPGGPLSAQETTSLSGLVRDPLGQPGKNVTIRLQNEQTGAAMTKTTDKRGRFVFVHRPCQSLSLEIRPPVTKGLSSALVEHIPGTETRQLVIHLKKGFAVTGKVIYKGKGIKGLKVKAVPDVEATKDEGSMSIYDGGQAITNGQGRYLFVLTPGPKILILSNEKTKGLVGEVRKPFTVTADAEVPDIVLFPSKQDATGK